MILNCNSCGKKFVVPDSAITSAGRMVQCGSCGNKWKQFPTKTAGKAINPTEPKTVKTKIQKPKKIKKSGLKKTREISLYSPEYLAKKHGIRISDIKPQKIIGQTKKESINFGLYNSLILFIVLIIFTSRILYFSQDFITEIFPISKFYLNYFFETIKNFFEIWKDLITY